MEALGALLGLTELGAAIVVGVAVVVAVAVVVGAYKAGESAGYKEGLADGKKEGGGTPPTPKP